MIEKYSKIMDFTFKSEILVGSLEDHKELLKSGLKEILDNACMKCSIEDPQPMYKIDSVKPLSDGLYEYKIVLFDRPQSAERGDGEAIGYCAEATHYTAYSGQGTVLGYYPTLRLAQLAVEKDHFTQVKKWSRLRYWTWKFFGGGIQ